MVPLLASLVPSTFGLPEGLLDDLPVVDRVVQPSRAPRACDLSRELHVRLARPSVDGDELPYVLACLTTGPIDPLDAWPAWTAGRSALDAARALSDPDLAGRRLVEVYAFGQAMRYGSLVSELAGLALQLEALDSLEALADQWSACTALAVRGDLEALSGGAPPLTLLPEAELLPETSAAPRWLAGWWTLHARSVCSSLEPVLETGDLAEIRSAVDAALSAERSRWLPDPAAAGILALVRDALPDWAAVQVRTDDLVVRLGPSEELREEDLLDLCDLETALACAEETP